MQAHEVYKVFGRRPERAVERLRAGASREELREEGLTAAVIDASFEVAEGEIFVVMGLSGSGKSTLIRMANGLVLPTTGSFEVGGEDLSRLDARRLRAVRREKVSMVFQHFALLPHRTVGENAAYGLRIKGVNRADRERRAEEALELVGLGGWGGHLPGELSGGMRQRVGLARALAAGTDLLLMDEAFSALDPLIRREMQDQLIELQDRLGKTILFITHDLNEAMRLGNRIAMMRDGRIVQVGTSEEILNDPANDYVAAFVQDVDRTRVLTASSVMEKPVAVIGADQGPRTAHRLMREHQTASLMVVDRDRDRGLRGVVTEDDVALALERGESALLPLLQPAVTVGPDVAVADLFAASAGSATALAVIDREARLLGVIPRVTLLSALGAMSNDDAVGSTGELSAVPAAAVTEAVR
ncbi:betaine/proline/choline family ABC transporter ATP-binding protein [Nocardioides sp. dk4132]|uniref:quaternary amine ABC transporter ATP-binding protein n=1 Tax=unclassified Nocardioides TaxID=2615069 RepID=UPI001296F2CA|nr:MULTISPECIES: glycine betaine/L-proline ABC transporter ATP-binding protein [unclassified Nocardioides]MQW76757.1 betaine/proline/choline family ABC transporter ATP-binding protein [Nocardioides sp. dk4132]QGA06888.1 betaine/proline/choline family ABC transporter ATP-binding protein [Nocardioides sp. dk884]